MKKLLNVAPHMARRLCRKFAWLPTEILGNDGNEYRIWMTHYVELQFYAAYGYSGTGYDYTPRGWHKEQRYELGFIPPHDLYSD